MPHNGYVYYNHIRPIKLQNSIKFGKKHCERKLWDRARHTFIRLAIRAESPFSDKTRHILKQSNQMTIENLMFAACRKENENSDILRNCNALS
jgi:hypothetical protein